MPFSVVPNVFLSTLRIENQGCSIQWWIARFTVILAEYIKAALWPRIHHPHLDIEPINKNSPWGRTLYELAMDSSKCLMRTSIVNRTRSSVAISGRTFDSCSWLEPSTKCAQIPRKEYLFGEVQISSERWTLDRADWVFFRTISFCDCQEIESFFDTSEWAVVTQRPDSGFKSWHHAWKDEDSTRRNARLFSVTIQIKISLRTS